MAVARRIGGMCIQRGALPILDSIGEIRASHRPRIARGSALGTAGRAAVVHCRALHQTRPKSTRTSTPITRWTSPISCNLDKAVLDRRLRTRNNSLGNTESDSMNDKASPENTPASNFETQAAGGNAGLALEIVDFLMQNKKWWLLPIFIVLGLVGGLLMLGSTAAAPFIYTLF